MHWLLLAMLWRGGAREANLTQELRAERAFAERLWRRGQGVLWFQHFRRAGGTSLCNLLREGVPGARFLDHGEACQPREWILRDATAVCGHNLSMVAEELRLQGGNAFALEYGPLPGKELLKLRGRRPCLKEWVFVAVMRDPWARFWSQMQHEMLPCLYSGWNLMACIGGNFDVLGDWWTPTAHPDSILGVSGAGLGDAKLYVDNYYTRVVLNRTDTRGMPLTSLDLERAMRILSERMSAVLIVEDFARSALQLTCSLGLDLERGWPHLTKRMRPYAAHELGAVNESELQSPNLEALRSRFVRRNSFDYALYAHARALARRRVAACARLNSEVADLRRHPPDVEVLDEAPPKERSLDQIFGCTGGKIEFQESSGQYKLSCPRTLEQHSASWWQSEEVPKREVGRRPVGADCWNAGFDWAFCCSEQFGPGGNRRCWDRIFTYERCCTGQAGEPPG